MAGLTALGAGLEVLAALEGLRAGGEPGDVVGRVSRVDRIEANVATAVGVERVTDGGHGPLGVGDWVAVRPGDPHREGRVIGEVRAVLPRRTALIRSNGAGTMPQTLAANVDEVAVVVPLDQPADAGRLERLLVLAYDSGASPRVILTKSDLGDGTGHRDAVCAAGPGVPILAVSSESGEGIEELAAGFGPGRSSALIGVSGAGKSSLVNAILGTARLPTGAVRAGDGQGRHTTTWRELVRLPGGGAVIDTPGLRSLGLWLDAGGIDATFCDVVRYAGQCRFSDCGHIAEPGCAVMAAMASGELAARRLSSYLAVRQEAAVVAERNEARLAGEDARPRSS